MSIHGETIWKLLLALLSVSAYSFHANGQTLPACSAAEVTYSSAPNDVEKNLQIVQVAKPINLPAKGRKVESIQGTRWFVEADPDYAANGPWTTTLYLGKAGSDQVLLKATFKDHGNTFSAHWINEELVFIQVWWGRIASSDLILDIAKGGFTYNKLANYGQSVEPCH